VAADGLTVTGKLADHTKSANSGKVTGREPWANLHLLFWLSLFPFATGWMGENHLAAWPTATYGLVLFAAAIAYFILQRAIIAAQGPSSMLRQAIGRDWKGKVSPPLYLLGTALSFVSSWAAIEA